MNYKAQAHLIEFILVIGIALAGLTTAYLWAKPTWNKASSKIEYQQFLDNAKKLFEVLNNINQIKEATISISYDSLFVNSTLLQITKKGIYYSQFIKGYWFPLIPGAIGINPTNGTLSISSSDKFLIIPTFRIGPSSITVRYWAVLKKDSESKCEIIQFQNNAKSQGNQITIMLLDTQYTNSPCPITVKYIVRIS